MKINKIVSRVVVGVALTCAAGSAAVAGTITKNPDLGKYWNSVSPQGTYIYADSFVADVTGGVSSLGTWLSGGSPNVLFQVFGSIGNDVLNGPDSANVFATTGTIIGQDYSTLSFVDGGAVTDIAALIAGQSYWFAISAVGQSGSGGYAVGAHTRNSGGIVDNGTFWYSNDPSGENFDGQSLTPEMAFKVGIGAASAVPEPTTIALLGLGLLGFAASRRKSAK